MAEKAACCHLLDISFPCVLLPTILTFFHLGRIERSPIFVDTLFLPAVSLTVLFGSIRSVETRFFGIFCYFFKRMVQVLFVIIRL